MSDAVAIAAAARADSAAPAAAPLLRSLAEPATAAVLSVATALPEGRLTNAEVAATAGVSEAWIASRTGITERRRAAPHERLTDFAAAAGARALAAAGVEASELDLVIVGTLTPDEVTPNAAPVVAHLLGADRAGAFDLGAACTAWLSGLDVATAQIESGRAELALVIGADFVTRVTDPTDRNTAPLFGDGAGAAVIGRSGGPAGGDGTTGVAAGAIGPIVLGADGSHALTLYATHADRTLIMDGHEVFRHAVARMSQACLEAVARAGLTLEEIDLLVPHQANRRITAAVGERLGIELDRVVDTIATTGNTSAATLPIALATAQADGRLRPGDRILLCAFGAGFTWGAGVVDWGAR